MLSHSTRASRLPLGVGLALLSGLGLMTAQPVSAQVQYTDFTSFDVMLTDTSGNAVAAPATTIFGINDSGEIAGSYTDSGGNVNAYYGTTAAGDQNGVDLSKVLSSQFQGFSEINKINNAGTYAGDFEMSTVGGYTTEQGFVGTNGSAVQTSLSNSQALGINNSNTTVGVITDSLGTSSRSYVQSGPDTTVFDVPGYGTSQANAINDLGVIVGSAAIDSVTGPTVSYIRSAGPNSAFSFLDIPDAYDVFAQGINNAGTIVGGYDTPTSNEQGFVLSGNLLTTIAFPNASVTEVEGINSAGKIVGTYVDSSGNVHGFLAEPVPEASTLLSFTLLLGLGGAALIAKRKKIRAA